MSWFKEIIVDVLVTVFILLTAMLEAVWMQYTLVGYTSLMLAVKLFVFFNDNYLNLLKKKRQTAPVSVIYQLYGINIAILILFDWWITAGLWLLIGIISYLTDKKMYKDVSRP
ncbi:MAG: hypothetical protein WEB89_05445 [Balneolales bacterium]